MVRLHVRGWHFMTASGRAATASYSLAIMAMGHRTSTDLANGLQRLFDAMVSGDPFMGGAVISSWLAFLLASGETADGMTHLGGPPASPELLMDLVAIYSHPLSQNDSVFLYVGYIPRTPLGRAPTCNLALRPSDYPMTPIAASTGWHGISTHVAFGGYCGLVPKTGNLEVLAIHRPRPDSIASIAD